MDHIKLDIYIISERKNLAEVFSRTEPVKDVEYEFHTLYSASELPDLSGRVDAMLVSDDADPVIKYAEEKWVGAIYIGSATALYEKSKAAAESALEIWDPEASDEYYAGRFRKIMNDCIMMYHGWLSDNYLMSLIDSMQDLVWFKSADGLHWLVNKKFEDTVHKTREQIHGMGHNYIWDVPPEDGGKAEFRCLESEREVMETKATCVADEQVKTDTGLRHFLTYKSPLFGRNGEVMGTVGIGHDVTDLDNTSLELKILLDNLPNAVVVCDNRFKAVQSNAIFEKEFGIKSEELMDFDYTGWRDAEFEVIEPLEYNKSKHAFHSELKLPAGKLHKHDRIYELTEKEVLDYYGNVTGYYCIFSDVTGAREYESAILEFANTDGLTKLYNRRYFFTWLDERKDQPLTVLFMDMDHFKSVNDTLGHATGDSVLVTMSKMIEEEFSDGLVARLGGDEFAVAIMGNPDMGELRERADKFEREVETGFNYMNLGLSVSIGIAETGGELSDVDAFLNESDERMYEEKASKRSR